MEGLTPSKIKAFPCFQIFQQAMIELHEDIPAWVQHLEQGGHAYSCPLKVYGPKWHNLSSSGCQISILRVRGPKWHLETSSRAAGVFNSRFILILPLSSPEEAVQIATSPEKKQR